MRPNTISPKVQGRSARAPNRPLATPRFTLLFILVGLAWGTGCARNAFLEIELRLPGVENGLRYVSTQVRDPGFAFSVNWDRSGDPAPVDLQDVDVENLSVESKDESKDIHIKVLFCTDPNCTDANTNTPQFWFAVEHPFYIGERTRWTRTLTSPTAPPTEEPQPGKDTYIDKCEVQGCAGGSTSVTNFCVGSTNTHFCER